MWGVCFAAIAWEVCFSGDFVLAVRGFLIFFCWLGSASTSNRRCHSGNAALVVLVLLLVNVILIMISSESAGNTESALRSQSLLNLKEAGQFHFPRYKYAVGAAL